MEAGREHVATPQRLDEAGDQRVEAEIVADAETGEGPGSGRNGALGEGFSTRTRPSKPVSASSRKVSQWAEVAFATTA